MKNTIKKESRTLLLSCTVLAGIMTLWCIYSIIQGALSFIANPINGNVFESDELFWVLFIFGFPLSFILFNMTSYSVFNISSRGVEEDAMSGCLYTIIINIFIMPLFTTALIYYALWLLLEIALFLIPYIGALLLAGLSALFGLQPIGGFKQNEIILCLPHLRSHLIRHSRIFLERNGRTIPLLKSPK